MRHGHALMLSLAIAAGLVSAFSVAPDAQSSKPEQKSPNSCRRGRLTDSQTFKVCGTTYRRSMRPFMSGEAG